MKHRLLRRGTCLLLAIGMMLTSASCGKVNEEVAIEPMELEEVYSNTFEFLGGKDVMPIMGFYGPYSSNSSYDGVTIPDYITDEIFSLIAESGVNLLTYAPLDFKSQRDQVYKDLELGEKYGVGLFVTDSNFSNVWDPEKQLSTEQLDEVIKKYSNYASFCGVYVSDEVGTSYYHPEVKNHNGYISDWVEMTNRFDELGLKCYLNLINGGSLATLEDYSRYVNEFATSLNIDYVASTNYPIDGVGEQSSDKLRAERFKSFEVVRKNAELVNVPFFAWAQAGGSFNDSGKAFETESLFPTEGQFYWQISTALAYGAKGLSYFPLIQPLQFATSTEDFYDAQRNGLIGVWGNKTQWFYYAKNMNAHIAAIDHVLMNAVNKGVIINGEEVTEDLFGENAKGNDYVIKGTSWRELKDVTGNVMIGCFNYQGKTALYVANYERDYAQKVTLDLVGTYNMTVTQKTDVSRVKTDSLVLDMDAGEGVLIVVED